jgi:hypothetical protein
MSFRVSFLSSIFAFGSMMFEMLTSLLQKVFESRVSVAAGLSGAVPADETSLIFAA